jgi:hypothetical protein
VGAAVTLGAVGLLVVSCGESRSRSDSVDEALATPASAPVSTIAPRNEAFRQRPAEPTTFNKVADTKPAESGQAGSQSLAAAGPGMPPASAVNAPGITGAMIIRQGTASIEIDSLDAAIARIRTLALRVNGYIATTTVQGGRDQLRTASLEVKIPSERFDDALAGLSPIGKVESVNVNAEDVGEEYVDIAARVENARRLEARIIQLLANRTGKLQDVLSVERELARVREEIERYEGRMRYLRTRAAVSTLMITVHEHAPVIVPIAGDGPILVAFRDAWRSFVSLSAGFIASLGVLIPLGAVVFLAWLGVRRHIPWRPSGGTPPATGVVSGN